MSPPILPAISAVARAGLTVAVWSEACGGGATTCRAPTVEDLDLRWASRIMPRSRRRERRAGQLHPKPAAAEGASSHGNETLRQKGRRRTDEKPLESRETPKGHGPRGSISQVPGQRSAIYPAAGTFTERPFTCTDMSSAVHFSGIRLVRPDPSRSTRLNCNLRPGGW